MYKITILLLFLIFGVAGCDFQRGQFVNSGSTSNALSPNVGCIDIVSGTETKQNSGSGYAGDQNLVYAMFITPARKENSSSSRDDYGKYVTTLDHTWNTEMGGFSVSMLWDRSTDVIAVGSRQFERAKGNVFVIEFAADSKVTGQQLGSLGPHANSQQVVEFVRRQLPNDKLVNSVNLQK